MPPIPCAHCGNNFMRSSIDPDAPKLCNNCLIREERRTTKGESKMSTIDILITCPRETQIEIEELCINQGIDFTRYFLELHHGSQAAIAEMKKLSSHPRPIMMGKAETIKEEPKPIKKGNNKK